MRQAVAYARVSSKEQEKEGFSIPSQLKLLRDYVLVEGIQVVEEYVDVETAKQAGRSSFGEMVDYLHQHPETRIILVEKTDRLYRNLKDWVTLDELDLEIHFVKEGVVLSADSRSSEKFMHGIKVLMAKNYIDNLSEETRKGMTEKAEQGIWPSYAPYGYRNVLGENGKKTIEPDPELVPVVRQMFEWYATGRFSVKDATRMAREAGLAFRKSGNPMPRSSVHKMLRNSIYMGEFVWKGKTYQGNHEPIINRELWDKAQAVLDGRNARPTRKTKREFAFTGLIRCGHCGCSMVAEIKKSRYVYYHCSRAKGKCPEPYTREEVLEERFAELLDRLRFDDEVLAWVSQALRVSHGDEKQHHEDAIRRIQAEYDRLQNRIDAMYVDKLDGRIDTDFFDRKAAEWREEQRKCLALISEHQDANQTYLDEGIRLLELAQKAGALFRKQSPAEKRRLLGFVLSNCTWKDGELTAAYRQPFDLLAKNVIAFEKKKLGKGAEKSDFDNWLPGTGSNRRPSD
ncbi:MAG: recombinase family protein [Sedimenticolaceae bacterium]